MKMLAFLLGLLGLALLFGPTISAFVLGARSRANRKRVEALEAEVARLRRQLEQRTGFLRGELEALKAAASSPARGAAGGATSDPETIGSLGRPEPAVPLVAVDAGTTDVDDTAPFLREVKGQTLGEGSPQPATPEVGADAPAEPAGDPGPIEVGDPTAVEPVAVTPESGASDPPPPSSPLPPSPPPPPAESAINWEHWVGVRGAALLGGIVLAFAALLLLKLSIERGLIPPPVRVVLGYLVGVGAILAGQWLRPRDYAATANALAGSGTVILYGSTWAADSLFGLIAAPVAWGLMILVTVTACLLAWRHRSLVIALLGLVGGFVTPLLLQSGFDHPIGLFGYILILDAGLLLLARPYRWSRLVWLCLAATTLYQAVWILDAMQAGDRFTALLVLALFAGLFVAASLGRGDGIQPGTGGAAPGAGRPILEGAAALLLPFLFALYLAGRADLGPHLIPVAGLLVVLSAAACWLAARLGLRWLGASAAVAGATVVWVWLSRTSLDPALSWEMAAIALALAGTFHAYLEWLRWRGQSIGREEGGAALISASLLLFATLPFGSELPGNPEAWWLVWAGLSAILTRQTVLTGEGKPALVAGFGSSMGFTLQLAAAGEAVVFPLFPGFVAVTLGVALALQLLGLARRSSTDGPALDRAALLFGLVFLLGLVGKPVQILSPPLYFGVWLLFSVLSLLAVTRLASGRGYAWTLGMAAISHWSWSLEATEGRGSDFLILGLLGGLVAVLLFTAWVFVARRAFVSTRLAWYSSAVAGPLFFLPMGKLWGERLGDGAIGLLPLLLGSIALAAAFYGRGVGDEHREQGWRNLVWFSAVALCFVSVAIPLQLEKEWVTIGWALNGMALIFLWRRLDHPGLKFLGLSLLAVVSIRLLANPEVLGYHLGDGLPVLNWLLYTYLVPATALVASAGVLGRLEVERRRSWEPGGRSGRAFGALACGGAAILVVFAWINLTIVDAFSSGGQLVLSWDRRPARDLTLSLAWAVYALILLGIGLRRRSSGLRWLSLVFLLLTIAKVFLHDLGALEDLYRVASLVGLAASLIVVSLCYQRFVFRKGTS